MNCNQRRFVVETSLQAILFIFGKTEVIEIFFLSPPSPSSYLTPSISRQFTLELPTFQVAPANSLWKLSIAHLLRHSSHISDQASYQTTVIYLTIYSKWEDLTNFIYVFSDQTAVIYFKIQVKTSWK